MSSSRPHLPPAPRPRVLLTADTVGGVWTFACDLAEAIGRAGGTTLIAALGPPPTPAQEEAAAAIRSCLRRCRHCRLEWMEAPWDDVRAAGAWLLELAADWQPDVAHVSAYAHATLRWPCPVVLTAHSCVYSWFAAVKGEPPPEDVWGEYFRTVRAGLAAADRVVAPTAAMRDALACYGLPVDHFRVIPNGRPPERFRNLRRRRPRVFAAGRIWDEAKNLAAVEAAAPQLPWPCEVAGGESADGHRPATPVHLGRLSAGEMEERLARAAIFAHPALYEPFGLAPLEAGLSGCALVLGDIPSLREVWGPEAALYVDPRRPAELVDAVRWLAARPSRWQRYGRRARRRALRYSDEAMGTAYRDLYDEVRLAALS
jgi:glycogen synthase